METRKIATKLTPRISEFVKEKAGLDYRVDENCFFHYPNYRDNNGFKLVEHLNSRILIDYEEVTEQKFINYFNENETMKTKFIDVSGTSKPEKKETVFTHGQTKEGQFIEEDELQPKHYKEVYYLGEFIDIGSLFQAVNDNGYSFLFKGIKGDEFNS